MPRHNNVIPNQHFKKQWDTRVRTWFSQPARKVRRREARAKKAAAVFPRPVAGPLRPVVHSQTQRYNTKIRAGRGFTLDELKAAKIPVKYAPTIGICVDHRRKNRSVESLEANVERLKAYTEKLILFPRRRVTKAKAGSAKAKSGDAPASELATAVQLKSALLPITKPAPVIESVVVTAEMKATKAYQTLRVERMNTRMVGIRAKKAAEAAKEAEEKAKQ